VVTINSNLRMTSLINGNVDCQPVSTLKADILIITYAHKLHAWSLELYGNNAHYVTYGEHAYSLKVKGQHILLLLFLHNFVHGLCIVCVFNRFNYFVQNASLSVSLCSVCSTLLLLLSFACFYLSRFDSIIQPGFSYLKTPKCTASHNEIPRYWYASGVSILI